jgi:signal transduction histidine kinase
MSKPVMEQWHMDQAHHFLAEASVILGGSLDEPAILGVLAQLVIPVLADGCMIDRVDDQGTILLAAVTHVNPDQAALMREIRRRYPLTEQGAHPVQRVLATQWPLVTPPLDEATRASLARDAAHLVLLRRLELGSTIITPLVARGHILGTLSLVRNPSAPAYGVADLALVEDLARRAALAIDNARLYAAERQARASAEIAQQRMTFLAEASAVLTSSLDYETTLTHLARLAVPVLADCCTVYLVEPDGTIRALAVAHVDPAKEERARTLQQQHPIDPTGPRMVARVIRSGQAELLVEVTDEHLDAIVASADERAFLTALGPRSLMAVPLQARERTLGVITMTMAESGRRFTPTELRLAEDIARRAALAIDNARLYGEAQTTLQHLRESQAQLVETGKLAAVGTLAAGVAHELNQPLMVIRGHAQVLLATGHDTGRLGAKLRLMERQTEQMMEIIEHLRTFSKTSADPTALPVDLNTVVREALLFISAQLHEQNIRLYLDLAAPAPVALAEANQIEQIVLHLLTNARDAVRRDGEIVVSTWRAGDQCHLTVTDNGTGIADDVLPRLFEPFFTTKPVGQGTGLGLSSSRQIAQTWGGDLTLANRSDHPGVRAHLTLPASTEGDVMCDA